MKQLLLMTIMIFPFAFASADCGPVKPEDIVKMQEYLMCQNGGEITSCAVLGAALVGRPISGRFIDHLKNSKGETIRRMQYTYAIPEQMGDGKVSTESVKKKAAAEIRKAEIAIERIEADKSLATDVRQRLRMDFRKTLAEQRAIQSKVLSLELKGIFSMQPPSVKNISGRYIDVANTAFKDLPDDFRRPEMEEFFQKRITDLEQGRLLDLAPKSAASRQFFLRTIAPKAIGKGAFDLAKKGALLAIGGGSLAAQIGFAALVYSPSTGCSSLTEKYTNAQGSDCEPQVGLSPGVLEFLALSSEQQQSYLKDRKVCAFYAQLKNKVLNQSVGKVTCGAELATYQVYNNPYGSYLSTIRFRENKTIQSVRSDFGKNGAISYQVDDKGNDVSLKSEGLKDDGNDVARDSVAAAKLFATEVANCCQSEGKTRESCLKSYNGSPATPLVGADGHGTASAAGAAAAK